MMIMPFFIYSIGTSVYILNMSRSEDDGVLDEYIGHWVFDVFVNQYLLALGDWSTDNYKYNEEGGDENVILLEILFLCATFFTAVTALNMLIAIMGDTFDKVLAAYESHSREMKLKIL